MKQVIHRIAFFCVAVACLAAVGLPGACAAASEAEDNCVAVRAAYDVGSSTTKVKVARVDVCQDRILEVLLEESESVAYQEDLSRAEDGALSETVRREGLQALRQLQAAASEYEPVLETGVATAALRKAVNGDRFLRLLRDQTRIDLSVISDEKEAMLGFQAVVANLDVEPGHVVVWDIGGGSMQVIARRSGDARHGRDDTEARAGDDMPRQVYHEGRTASVRFRDRIIRDLQGRNPDETQTPNPISPQVAEAALALARELAGDLPDALAQRMRDPKASVVGIGGVHYYSIRGQLDTEDGPYTREQVAAVLENRIGQTDDQIGGPFANTEVSNLILVLGHMQAWGIEKVQPANVTISDGLLLRPMSVHGGK